MRRCVLVLAALMMTLLFASRSARAEADASGRAVDLYTIGPGDYLYSRYGHSLLCVRDAGADPAAATARCYDYGVPDRDSLPHVAWTVVRGQPSFVPVALGEQVVLDFFRGQGRSIERQRLPLSPAEVARLVERLEADVAGRRAYAYHPYWSNCTTQVRDRIDEATTGRLRAARTMPQHTRFRDLAEEGLSGRLAELTVLAFVLGPANDRVPDGWEAMFLPAALRDAVTDRFGAPAQKIADRQAVVLPTSSSIGRAALFLLAIALWAAVRFFVGRGRLRGALFVAGGVLGALGCITALVAAIVVWPEMSRNWALALLVPTDLALPFLARRWLRVYARVRIGIAVAFGVLELVGVVSQPLLPLVALVVLPFASVLGTLAARKPAPAEDPVPQPSVIRG